MIPDFPKKGIMFQDITSITDNKLLFKQVINEISKYASKQKFTKIAGVEARGFIFGAAVAFKRVMKRIINMDDRISPPAKEKKQEKINHFVNSKLDKMIIPDQTPSALSTKNIEKRIEVPNVLGKSLKKAMAMLANVGLKVKVNGSGKVIEQFPKPGSLSKSSKLCILTLK